MKPDLKNIVSCLTLFLLFTATQGFSQSTSLSTGLINKGRAVAEETGEKGEHSGEMVIAITSPTLGEGVSAFSVKSFNFMLESELKTGVAPYKLVPRHQIDKVMSEQNFQESDLGGYLLGVEYDKRSEIQQWLKANVLITILISRKYCSFQVIDIRKGEIIVAKNIPLESLDELEIAIESGKSMRSVLNGKAFENMVSGKSNTLKVMFSSNYNPNLLEDREKEFFEATGITLVKTRNESDYEVRFDMETDFNYQPFFKTEIFKKEKKIVELKTRPENNTFSFDALVNEINQRAEIQQALFPPKFGHAKTR